MTEYERDLIVLVADGDMYYSMKALLARHHELGCRKVEPDIFKHPQRDSGCFNDCHNFLRKDYVKYRHALVLLDRAFSRNKKLAEQSREYLESILEGNLARNGWADRAAAVMIDPELEAWVWSDSQEVDRCLGWHGRNPDLRSWLRDKALWAQGSAKPGDPKEAMEAAMREVNKPRSSRIFEKLARAVDFRRCEDRSFIKLTDTLRRWFA
jgi:hypothetical protein